jgi:hypothetical protein
MELSVSGIEEFGRGLGRETSFSDMGNLKTGALVRWCLKGLIVIGLGTSNVLRGSGWRISASSVLSGLSLMVSLPCRAELVSSQKKRPEPAPGTETFSRFGEPAPLPARLKVDRYCGAMRNPDLSDSPQRVSLCR